MFQQSKFPFQNTWYQLVISYVLLTVNFLWQFIVSVDIQSIFKKFLICSSKVFFNLAPFYTLRPQPRQSYKINFGNIISIKILTKRLITAIYLEYGCLENGCLDRKFISKNWRSVSSRILDGCLEFSLENGYLENCDA